MAETLTYTCPRKRRLSIVSAAPSLSFGAAPGARDGPFRVLYVLERALLAEVRNATVHAFLVSVLTETPGGYRLYWAVYVYPVSRLTPLYIALIEPFHRCLVYPASFRRIRRAWEECYTRSLDPPASGTV